MATRNRNRNPAATTGGLFGVTAQSGQNAQPSYGGRTESLNERYSQPSGQITESQPQQLSSNSRVNPAGSITDVSPSPGEAGQRAIPVERGPSDFRDASKLSGDMASAIGLGSLASRATGALPGMRALSPMAGPLGVASTALGFAQDAADSNYAGMGLKALGMANPMAGAVADAAYSGYKGYTQGPSPDNKGFFGQIGTTMGAGQGIGDSVTAAFGNSWLGRTLGMDQNSLGTPGVTAYGAPMGREMPQATDLGPLGQNPEDAARQQAEVTGPYASGFLNSVYGGYGGAGGNDATTGGVGESVGAAGSSTSNYGSRQGFSGHASADTGGHGTGGYGGTGGTGDADGGLKTSYGTLRADGTMSFADGGQVGMASQMYSGGMSPAPSSLSQMGFANGGGVGMQAPGGNPTQQDPMAVVARMTRDTGVQQKVRQLVGPAMQSGQLTPEELVTLGRIAEASIHNPQLYPQLRKFALENGLTPLPPSYDQRVATMLVVAAKVMGGAQQATPPGQVPPTDQAQMQNPTGAPNGGMLSGPGTGRSDSIGTVNESNGSPVKVANGEYVIPEHVVKAKGKDFFDKMLRQYAQLTPTE